MKKLSVLVSLIATGVLLASCVCLEPGAGGTANFKVVVIGKSVHPYWSNVEAGIQAAAKDLGLRDDQVVFFVPPAEDVTKQIEAMETYVAQGVTGIAVAPSDPLEAR